MVINEDESFDRTASHMADEYVSWNCPPLHLTNWNNFWKWKTEMKYDQEVYEALAENERNASVVKSPCIGKCTYEITIQKCNDCNRTKEEISTWYIMTDDEKLAVLKRLKELT